MKRKKIFTLVELLIVIAIIVILAAMLLPALNKARDKAKASSCISNMKQISLALDMYQNDNRDLYPEVQGGASFTGWTSQLYDHKYIPNYGTMVCPSRAPYSDARNKVAADVYWEMAYLTYGMGNTYYTGAADRECINSKKAFAPSRSEVILDSVNLNPPAWVNTHGFSPEKAVQTLVARKHLGSSTEAVELRHNKKTNVVFMDGHIAALGSADEIPMHYNNNAAGYRTLMNRYYLVLL